MSTASNRRIGWKFAPAFLNTNAGWNAKKAGYVASPISASQMLPRSVLMYTRRWRMNCAAGLPMIITALGLMASTMPTTRGQHSSCSSSRGSRFSGGRQATVLVMKVARLVTPASRSAQSSSCPAAPTNGTPCASSSAPGASPIKTSLALAEPDPKTMRLRVRESRHSQHPSHCERTCASFADTLLMSLVRTLWPWHRRQTGFCA